MPLYVIVYFAVLVIGAPLCLITSSAVTAYFHSPRYLCSKRGKQVAIRKIKRQIDAILNEAMREYTKAIKL